MPVTLPVAQDIRNELEGYNITPAIVSDTWINDMITNTVIPIVETACKTKFDVEQTAVDYFSGNGTTILMLHNKNINAIQKVEIVAGNPFFTGISLASVELVPGEGILKSKVNLNEGLYFSMFPKGDKNIKVTYTYGGLIANDQFSAIKKLGAAQVLKHVANMTGGGSITTEGWSRDFGKQGMYTNAIISLTNDANAILRKYMSGVVGS